MPSSTCTSTRSIITVPVYRHYETVGIMRHFHTDPLYSLLCALLSKVKWCLISIVTRIAVCSSCARAHPARPCDLFNQLATRKNSKQKMPCAEWPTATKHTRGQSRILTIASSFITFGPPLVSTFFNHRFVPHASEMFGLVWSQCRCWPCQWVTRCIVIQTHGQLLMIYWLWTLSLSLSNLKVDGRHIADSFVGLEECWRPSSFLCNWW